MPHATFRINGGVDENRTPALNEAGLSYSQLVRCIPDRGGYSLWQKLGGWQKFFPNTVAAIARALLGWEDTNEVKYLGVGTEAIIGTATAQLAAISGGVLQDITPRTLADNVAVDFSTVAGDSLVTIADGTVTVDAFYNVLISTHVSVGGLILYGLYPCIAAGAGTYQIQALNVLGQPQLAPNTETNGGLVAEFTTNSGDSAVTVTLIAHGYSVGNSYVVSIPTTVGGLTLFSNYIVASVTDADNFVIYAQTTATSSTSAFINAGDVNFTYYVGLGAIPAGTGYGIGAYGSGGYGTGTGIVPTTGVNIYADNWSLDNWGEILIASPHALEYLQFVPLTASGDSTTATLTFAETFTAPAGATVVVSGVTPLGYNGVHFVTSSGSGTLSFLSAQTGAMTGVGTIKVYQQGYSAIYQWRPTTGSPIATIIPNSPTVNEGVFVAMPQRQIIAWGSTFSTDQDPLLVRWCDVDDFISWIALVTNQAGSYRIPKGSRIVGGIQGPQQALIWTDLAIWAMQYVGQPYVYQFNEIGTGCGLIGRRGAISLNGIVYWMGQSQFYKLDGNGVSPILCPLWDVIFQDLDRDNLAKITVAANSRFGEVSWYYPTLSSGGEVTKYVKYNVNLGNWDFGILSRTAWINESVLGPPIGADVTRYLYQHETSKNADDQPLAASFQTGYFSMQDGDMQTFIDEVWPDMKWGYFDGTQNANVKITFYVADFPGATPTVHGPYSVTQAKQAFNPRMRGRLVSIKISSDDIDSFWRIGGTRYRFQSDGRY